MKKNFFLAAFLLVVFACKTIHSNQLKDVAPPDENENVVKLPKHHKFVINSLAVDPADGILVSIADGEIAFWDIKLKARMDYILSGTSEQKFKSVAISNSGNIYAACSTENLFIWTKNSQQTKLSKDNSKESGKPFVPIFNEPKVLAGSCSSLSFSADEKYVIADSDSDICPGFGLINLKTGEKLVKSFSEVCSINTQQHVGRVKYVHSGWGSAKGDDITLAVLFGARIDTYRLYVESSELVKVGETGIGRVLNIMEPNPDCGVSIVSEKRYFQNFLSSFPVRYNGVQQFAVTAGPYPDKAFLHDNQVASGPVNSMDVISIPKKEGAPSDRECFVVTGQEDKAVAFWKLEKSKSTLYEEEYPRHLVEKAKKINDNYFIVDGSFTKMNQYSFKSAITSIVFITHELAAAGDINGDIFIISNLTTNKEENQPD